MKNYLDQKVKGCEYLVKLNRKKINKTHIIAAANEVGLAVPTMEKAWKNFVQTGGKYVDKRSKCNNIGAQFIAVPKERCVITKQRTVTVKEAAEILLKYMEERNSNYRAICNDYKITPNQFYGWINELNVKGTLLGKTILNPKKYAKVNILDAIWLYKRPETKRKSIAALTATEKLAYKRVGDVLVHYLSAL